MDLDTFSTHLSDVRPTTGGIMALCPAHDDHTPSLSVTEGQSGLLVWCQSQHCDIHKIMDKLGLPMSALFYDDRSIAPRQPERVHRYVDEQGWLLYEQVRFPPKDFRSRHLEDGKWVWNLKGCRRVLYNLDKLAAIQAKLAYERDHFYCNECGETPLADVPVVYFVEGEKDADTITEYGEIGTTCLGGVKKFLAHYVKWFVGLDVRIIRDKDAVGAEHAAYVADCLTGVASRVSIWEAAHGKDVTDHKEAGFTLSDLRRVA